MAKYIIKHLFFDEDCTEYDLPPSKLLETCYVFVTAAQTYFIGDINNLLMFKNLLKLRKSSTYRSNSGFSTCTYSIFGENGFDEIPYDKSEKGKIMRRLTLLVPKDGKEIEIKDARQNSTKWLEESEEGDEREYKGVYYCP